MPLYFFSGGGGGGSVGATGLPLQQFIPASAMVPRVTAGPSVNSSETATNRHNYDTLDFDQTTEEGATFDLVLPSGGTFTAEYLWTADSGSGAVVWATDARALADDDAIDGAFGTAQNVTDTLLAAGDLHDSPLSAATTVAGTPVAGRVAQFRVRRVAAAGGDTLAVDARLRGVILTFQP